MKNFKMGYSKILDNAPRGYFKDFSRDFNHKTIQYIKIDDTYAYIYYNGSRVGHIENHLKSFVVEIFFKRITVLRENSLNIKKFIHDYYAWHQFELHALQSSEKRGFKIKG
jgi:hypothetical protein